MIIRRMLAGMMLAVVSVLVLVTPGEAQWQVPNHAVPIGKGAGTGFSSAAPATRGRPLTSRGASTDPAFGGDVYFESGRPWADVRAYGALGDGSTDDTTAIQAAINAVQVFGTGGTVYFPPSNAGYCVKTAGGVTVSGIQSVRLLGASGSVSISACGVDTTVITLNSGFSVIEELFIQGKGTNNDTGTFGATNDALVIGTSCVECLLKHMFVWGGRHAIASTTGEFVMEEVNASTAYGSSVVYIRGGAWILRSKFDQQWPQSAPAAPLTIAAWASTTAYSLGAVVSTGGYFIQATTAGTSGGSAPTLKNYGVAITDGSVVWQLVAPSSYASLQIDTGAAEVQVFQSDFTGPFSPGILISNTLAGTAPNSFIISDSVVGQNYSYSIRAEAGNNLTVDGTRIGGCHQLGCANVSFAPSWNGDAIISNSVFLGGPIGIAVSAGKNYTFTGNSFYGTTSNGIVIATNINAFTITNNCFCNSTAFGANQNAITVNAGTSDYYTIANNNFSGVATTSVVDGGTGTNKFVSNQNTISSIVSLSNATAATSTSTGALVVATGGVGVGGSVWAGNLVSNSGVTAPNYIITNVATFTNIAAPSSPAAAHVAVYSDLTDQRFHDKNAAGTIGTTVVADTGASNNFLTAISAAGVISKAQPAFSNLSGSATCAQLPALTGDVTTSAGACATTLANIPTATVMAGSLLATNIAAPGTPASGKTSIYVDSTDKRLHDKNDAGTIGTTVVADAGASNNFLTAISAAGVISKAQPTVGNLTGFGTGVATALGVNVGTAGAFVVNGGALGSPSSAGTLPAFTLGGTVAGGGNQINNVIIGTSTPLAGSFTTVSGSTSATSPLIIGGSGAASTLTIESTSGAGTSDFIAFKTASQTERMRILTTGQVNIAASNSSNLAWLVINNNASAAAAVTPGGPVQLLLAGADATTTTVQMYAYANSNIFQFLRGDGTGASPSGLQADELIGGFGFAGYTSAAAWTVNRARILGFASEIWSGTAQGSYFTFETTVTGTTTRAERVRIQASGGVSVGTTTDLGTGTVLANSTIKTLSATASTSSTTGSGIFGGGVGVAGAMWAGTYVATTPTTVGGLPSCAAGTKGARMFVTDSNAASYTAGIGAVVAAGGTTNVPVSCDGTNWRIGANDNIPAHLMRKFA